MDLNRLRDARDGDRDYFARRQGAAIVARFCDMQFYGSAVARPNRCWRILARYIEIHHVSIVKHKVIFMAVDPVTNAQSLENSSIRVAADCGNL